MVHLTTIRLAGISIALLAVSLVLWGFWVDPDGFVTNLLAEGAGILVSVLLAIFIFDKLVEREKRRRWAEVSSETTQGIRLAVVRGGREIYMLIPVPRPPAADPFLADKRGVEHLAEALRNLRTEIAELSARAPLPASSVAECLDPHVQTIRNSFMPRLLAIGEPDLVHRIAALESSFQNLQHGAWVEDRLGVGRKGGQAIAEVIDSLADVAEGLMPLVPEAER